MQRLQNAARGGPGDPLTDAWRAIPATLQHALFVLLIIAGARVILQLVPALERLVTRRAALRSAHPRNDPTDSQLHHAQRLQTLVRVVGSVARTIVWAVAVVMLLAEVGLDVKPLLAGAGIAGVAIGFGAQSIVKDFFSGFFIVLENQFDVGDQVTINGVTGAVEEMTMRVTVVRDLAGAVHYFPNGSIGTVINRTAGWLRASVDVATPVSAPASEVRRVLEEVAAAVNNDPALAGRLKGLVEVEGPTDFNGATVTWRLQAKARPSAVHFAREGIVAALQRRVPLDEKGALSWLKAVEPRPAA